MNNMLLTQHYQKERKKTINNSSEKQREFVNEVIISEAGLSGTENIQHRCFSFQSCTMTDIINQSPYSFVETE